MNIQIFGLAKSFDTKKAERWFKERRIAYQFVDMKRFGLSGREFDSVLRAVGGVDKLVDWEGKDPELDRGPRIPRRRRTASTKTRA